MDDPNQSPAEIRLAKARRRFIQALAAGTTVVTLGGIAYAIAGQREQDDLAAQMLDGGRRRLPPGQRAIIEKPDSTATVDGQPQPEIEPVVETPPDPKLIRVDATSKQTPRLPPGQTERSTLKPMGGRPGDPSRDNYILKVHGEVENPTDISFRDLQGYTQIEQTCDVHCVTGWSLLGAVWSGVRVADIAERVKPTNKARYVIFEAAHGYTANVDIEEALKPNVLVAYEVNQRPLAQAHGSPVRGLVPDRYFWKSAKYLTGIYFSDRDYPGFWETRGYHNRADPWKQERFS
ncbi:MAG: molybdopterin-dependent oxidoreductase [Planctomycetes bacterium]|nr:molybdopterin-dependent oxidoreductase [Planctomycetota bacterium]